MRKVMQSACGGKSRKAFTLIELLIVIAIIGILAAVIFVSLNAARKKAYDAQVKSDMTSLSQALEIVKIDRPLTPMPLAFTQLIYDKDNLGTSDRNIARWTDRGDAATGGRLEQKLPINQNNTSYFINIGPTSSDYALISALSIPNKFFCVHNGQSFEIIGVATAAAGTTPAVPVFTDAKNQCATS